VFFVVFFAFNSFAAVFFSLINWLFVSVRRYKHKKNDSEFLIFGPTASAHALGTC